MLGLIVEISAPKYMANTMTVDDLATEGVYAFAATLLTTFLRILFP